MEPHENLALATSYFLSVFEQVDEAQLQLPTPCEEWSVAELLWHVTRGSEMAAALVRGASQTEASGFMGMEPGDDVFGQCRMALDEQMRALNAADDPEMIVHHPIGDVSLIQLFGFRIGDLTLHGWDLARAIGADDVIPEGLAEVVYADMLPLAEIIGQIGLFGQGPSGAIGDDSTVQLKLLDLVGRRP